MKVCVAGTRGFPGIQGGIEKHCEELYRRLVALGVDVTVFVRSPYIPEADRDRVWEGVKLKSLWCPRSKSLEALVHSTISVFAARMSGADILHLHAVGPSLVAPLARLLRMRVVMTHHGADYERQKWSYLAKQVLRLGEYLGVHFASRTIVISGAIGDMLARKFPKVRCDVIPNGVSSFDRCDEPKSTIVARHGLVPGGYVFTACRIVPEKGLHDLIAAWNQPGRIKIPLVIAGSEDHESDYGRSLKRSAEANGVILTGSLYGEDFRELFSQAKLFVLPSYHEGFPISLLEAFQLRVPVLVSNIGPHRELAVDRSRYFEAGNVDDLRAKLEQLISAPPDSAEIEKYGRMVESKFNWDRIAEQTLDVYRSVSAS